MLFESIRSRFGKWHLGERHSVTITSKVDLANAKTELEPNKRNSYDTDSDFCVRLIGVKSFSKNHRPLYNWNSDASGVTFGSLEENSIPENQCEAFEDCHHSLKRHETFIVNKITPSNSDAHHVCFEGALRAASTGDAFFLKRCIDVLGIPVDTATSKGVTMLQCALVDDHVNCVKLLLRNGADIRKTTKKGRSALHTAARYNAVRSLKLLLSNFYAQEKEMDLSVRGRAFGFFFLRDNFGDTPLHLACRQNNERCLKLLLKSIEVKLGWPAVEEVLLLSNNNGQNPLHVACLWGCYRVVRFIITTNFEKAFGRTTLSSQSRSGPILHEMASRRCKNSHFCAGSFNENRLVENTSSTVLTACFDERDVSKEECKVCEEALERTVKLILSKCPQLLFHRDNAALTPLMVAVMNDAVGVVNALFSSNVDEEDANCRTALHHAASRGIFRQVASLLVHGATPSHKDSRGITPLHCAAVRSFTSCLRVLYRANDLIDVPNANGHTAFMWAAMYGANSSLLAMLEVNPMLDRSENDNDEATALHLASCNDHYDTVKLLLRNGWYIEARNCRKETPLLAAAANARANALRALLESDADLYAVDQDRNSVFHLATGSDLHKECLCELLLVSPSSVVLNQRNLSGETPLFCAVKAGALRCVRELLKYGVDVRLHNLRGWNALMMAIQLGSTKIVDLLLRYNSNVNCYSAMDGCSPLTLAIDLGNTTIIQQLKALGAKLPCEIADDAARKIQRWYRRNVSLCNFSSGDLDKKQNYFGESILENDVLLIHKYGVEKLS